MDKIIEKDFYLIRKDGIKLKATLTKPSKEGNFNAVILCHGFSTGRNGEVTKGLTEQLKKDFITLRFDFYGHSESEGKFEDITISKALEDLDTALDYLNGLSNVKNIALYGSSFGGLTAILKAANDKRIKFLALRAPALSWEETWEKRVDIKKWKKRGFDYYYSSTQDKNLKINYSLYQDLIKHKEFEEARKINIPILIVHGDKDTDIPIENSKKLTKINKNIKLKIIKGMGHNYESEEQKKEQINIIVNFFKQNLK